MCNKLAQTRCYYVQQPTLLKPDVIMCSKQTYSNQMLNYVKQPNLLKPDVIMCNQHTSSNQMLNYVKQTHSNQMLLCATNKLAQTRCYVQQTHFLKPKPSFKAEPVTQMFSNSLVLRIQFKLSQQKQQQCGFPLQTLPKTIHHEESVLRKMYDFLKISDMLMLEILAAGEYLTKGEYLNKKLKKRREKTKTNRKETNTSSKPQLGLNFLLHSEGKNNGMTFCGRHNLNQRLKRKEKKLVFCISMIHAKVKADELEHPEMVPR